MTEKISALIDLEVNEQEHDEILERLCGEEYLQTQWHKYHFIRCAIQGNCTPSQIHEFATLSNKGKTEEMDFAANPEKELRKSLKVPWFKKPRVPMWTTGMGFGAAVSVVIVFGLIYFDRTQLDSQGILTEPVVPISVPTQITLIDSESPLKWEFDSRSNSDSNHLASIQIEESMNSQAEQISVLTNDETPSLNPSEDHLNQTLLTHGDSSNLTGVSGLATYAKIISYSR